MFETLLDLSSEGTNLFKLSWWTKKRQLSLLDRNIQCNSFSDLVIGAKWIAISWAFIFKAFLSTLHDHTHTHYCGPPQLIRGDSWLFLSDMLLISERDKHWTITHSPAPVRCCETPPPAPTTRHAWSGPNFHHTMTYNIKEMKTWPKGLLCENFMFYLLN